MHNVILRAEYDTNPKGGENMIQRFKKGFTLIELLVVIAIIALLSTLAVVSLNNARAKSRDAKRVSDIKQMQTALELYFADQQGYPASSTITVGTLNTSDCLSSAGGFVSRASTACDGSGITTYMGQVPAAQTPPSGNVYTYSGNADTYNLIFTLEGQTGSLSGPPNATHTATPSGIN